MKITFTFRHMDSSSDLKDHTEAKLERLLSGGHRAADLTRGAQHNVTEAASHVQIERGQPDEVGQNLAGVGGYDAELGRPQRARHVTRHNIDPVG